MTLPEKLHPITAKKLREFDGMNWYEVVNTIWDANPVKRRLQGIPFIKENIEEIQSLLDKVGMKARRIALQERLDQLAEGTNIAKPAPEGQIVAALKTIRTKLEEELLEKLKGITPKSFEKISVGLLEKIGYGGGMEGAGKVTGKPGDKGIDGIIYEDKLGLDAVCVQAKQYASNNIISGNDIQAFRGALSNVAKKGVFITTSSFTQSARDEANKDIDTKIILIDGKRLVELMIDYNFGVDIAVTHIVPKLDADFWDEYDEVSSDTIVVE